MTSRWPRAVLVGAVVSLVVLAPIVPDEPLHLSGVMVVAGIGLAVIAALGGVAQALRAEDIAARAEGRWVAALGVLALVGVLVTLFARLMSQFS